MEKNDVNKTKIGGRISILGILLNVLLAGCKIAVGSLFGLISVVADGLNNLTDCGSSVISFISFKLSSKPADKEHPYGHGRIEYICSLIIAFLMFFLAFDMIKESIGKILNSTDMVFSYWIVGVLAFSIVIKFSLFIFCKTYAVKLNSTVLSATATDSLMDCIATSVTLLSYFVGVFAGFNADGYAGVFVALFIGWSAYNITREITSTLIGKNPDESLISDIKNTILSYDGVLAVHDLAVYNFGPNKYFASVHIEVSASVNVLISHEIIDNIERYFAENTNIILTGHLDPIETDNPKVIQLRDAVENIIFQIDNRFKIHDFRIVFGEHNTNVLFDVVIPYETKLSNDEIKNLIEKGVKNINSCYNVIISIEHEL